MVVKATADGFRMLPTTDHMGHAQAHELSARIG